MKTNLYHVMLLLQGSKLMSNIRREWKITNGQLYLYTVTQFDNNVFFCDRELMEGGVKWTFRRSVNVRAISKSIVCIVR